MKTLERLRSDGLLSTEISKLESRLWRMVRREGLRSIMITSAVRGEGKSTTLAYVATSLGLYADRRIVCLDFDFRIPAMGKNLGLQASTGLDQVLSGTASIQDALITTELPGLKVALPSPGGADPALLQRSESLEGLMTSLRDEFDLILMDSPAIIPVADPTMLIPYADGVVIAAMAGKTTAPQLTRAREICEGMDANIIGLVVGNVEEAAPEYLSGSYDYDYHAVSQGGERAGASDPEVTNGSGSRQPSERSK